MLKMEKRQIGARDSVQGTPTPTDWKDEERYHCWELSLQKQTNILDDWGLSCCDALAKYDGDTYDQRKLFETIDYLERILIIKSWSAGIRFPSTSSCNNFKKELQEEEIDKGK